ncbi:MAG: hypothetical protein ATN36_08345 [Epulopiscium sp. Nele67-Bin005]|nr:MAG: hypothetical protein ATN36_08345 [Epulopiscium sp. Nele67-Bin005]
MINSAKNPIIAEVIALQKKKSTRNEKGLFVVEGLRAVKEVCEDDVRYFIATNNICKADFTTNTQWIEVSDEVFKTISDTKTPQGILAVVQQKNFTLQNLTQAQNSFYLVLENIQDPGNLGTVIRTAYSFGVDAIFITKGSADIYSPKVVRSTMGALWNTKIISNLEISEIFDWLNQHNISTYATDLTNSNPIYDVDFTEKVALIIGNEANGISQETRDLATFKVKIPMVGGESLNASIATGICLYEIMKQRAKIL